MIVNAAREQEEKEHVFTVSFSVSADAQESMCMEFTMIKCKRYVKIKTEEHSYSINACANFESLIKKLWQLFLDSAIIKASLHFNTGLFSSISCKVTKNGKKIYCETRKSILTRDRKCPESIINYLALLSDPNLIVE